jgi:dienelactone hydrolase
MRIQIQPLTFILVFILTGCAGSSGIRIKSDVLAPKYSSNIIGNLTVPEGSGPFPTVVLMHGCDGLSRLVKLGINQHASFFRDQGFATLVLDSFSSRGKNGGSVCRSFDAQAAARYYRTFDAFNTLQWLKSQDFVDAENIYLYGLSNGGSVAVLTAGGGEQFNFPKDLKYTAVAAFYPWCGMQIDYLASPLIVLAGELDDWTPPDGCVNQIGSVEGEEYRVVVYPNSYHSFDLPVPQQTYAGHIVGGNTESAEAARNEMLKFFIKHRK